MTSFGGPDGLHWEVINYNRCLINCNMLLSWIRREALPSHQLPSRGRICVRILPACYYNLRVRSLFAPRSLRICKVMLYFATAEALLYAPEAELTGANLLRCSCLKLNSFVSPVCQYVEAVV